MSKEKIQSVSELTNQIKIFLEDNFISFAVQGEISNFKSHTSGHRYFNLKDENAVISCTMWKFRALNFVPKEGMKVIVYGNITVYPPRGTYQIEVTSMVPSGIGDLYLAFEELKKKLSDQGYFEAQHKKRIPKLSMNIGVSTSATGAAIEDIKRTIERRFPLATIYFRPTLVQGDGSAEDIANAIIELEETPSEVIIIGRGGGSIEDLWSYNTEIVANAIFNCSKPIISAVGHETDFTIADFVADLRAATPTAAAELVTQNTSEDLINGLNELPNKMRNSLENILADYKKDVNNLITSYSFRSVKDKINTFKQYTDDLSLNADNSIKRALENNKSKIQYLISHFNSLEPLSPLRKGFAILKDKGRIINVNESLSKLKEIEISRMEESAKVKIIQVTNNLF
jgi:exodeoxyribonuclease VII large subunit